MTTQSRALELAEGLEGSARRPWTRQEVAIELRRLAAVEAELEAEREESKRWLVKAQNERDARKELEAELERIKPAWDEWHKKTEWVQETCKPTELGLHRADVLRMRIEALRAELERIRALQPVAWLHPANATCVTTDPTAYARGIPLCALTPKDPT